MGVFDFLKSKREAKLGIPPAPPLLEAELPEFPEIPKKKGTPKKVVKGAIERPPEISVEDIERVAVREQKAKLAEMEHPTMVKPIFVNVTEYRDVLDELGLMRNIMKEETDAVTRVSDFKEDEDREFIKWQRLLGDMQKKLVYVDKTLFG